MEIPAASPMPACPLALALFAPPKSGSTFLSSFLKLLSFHARMCRVTTTSWRCNDETSVGCPNAMKKPRCQHKRGQQRVARSKRSRVCTWVPHANHSFALSDSCCDSLRPRHTSELLDQPTDQRAALLSEASPVTCTAEGHAATQRWLFHRPRAWLWASQSSALESSGFVIGPIRTLSEPQATVLARVMSKHLTVTRARRAEGVTRLLSKALSLLAWQPFGEQRGEQRGRDWRGWAQEQSEQRGELAVNTLPRLAPALILHVRHPLEAIVSHFFCVTDATVCPRRRALLAAAGRPTDSYRQSYRDSHWGHGHRAANQSMLGMMQGMMQGSSHAGADIESFLLTELSGPAHTSSNQLLLRYERLATLVQSTRLLEASGLATVHDLGAAAAGLTAGLANRTTRVDSGAVGTRRGCNGSPPPTVILSRYELMVSDFASWLSRLLHALPDGVARSRSRESLHGLAHEAFADQFVPDGAHRHAVVPGANLARLSPSAKDKLRSFPRLVAVVDRLGYDWGGITDSFVQGV